MNTVLRQKWIKRAVPAFAAALVVSCAGLSTKASAVGSTLAPPFESHQEEISCDAAPPECVAQGDVTLETGAVSTEARVQSPGGGTLPGNRSAWVTENLFATHHLDAPVDFVHYRVTFHVDAASVSKSGTTGATPFNLSDASTSILLDAEVADPACNLCFAFHRTPIVSTETGPATRSDEDVMVGITLSRSDGQPIPAGDVALRFTVETNASLAIETGNAATTMTGHVERIVVAEPRGHLAPPFDDSRHGTGCYPLDVDPLHGCNVAANANPTNGRLQTSAQVTSPAGGVVPAVQESSAWAEMSTVQHLDQPTEAVQYNVSVHVASAEAEVGGVTPNPENAAFSNLVVRFEHLDPSCDSCRVFDVKQLVASNGPRVSVTSQDFTIGLTLHPFLGGALPAGDVRITALVQTFATHVDVGTARASADVTITGIKAV